MSLSWTQDFVGIPYASKGRSRAGCDCWGLVMLVYRATGIDLPGYEAEYLSSDERIEIAKIAAREKDSSRWQPVDLAEAQELDVLCFRRGRYDAHAAVYLKPGLMLHMVEDDCSKVERWGGGAWVHRLAGVYRWQGARP